MAGPVRKICRLLRTYGIVFAQQLIANERVRIAADLAIARHEVVRLHGHARAETINGVGVGVISLAAIISRGGVGSLGCDQRAERNRSCQHDLGDEHLHLTSPCTIGLCSQLLDNVCVETRLSAIAPSATELPRLRFHESVCSACSLSQSATEGFCVDWRRTNGSRLNPHHSSVRR